MTPMNMQFVGIQAMLSCVQKAKVVFSDGCQDIQQHVDQRSVFSRQMTSPRQLPIVKAMQADCVQLFDMNKTFREMVACLREQEKSLVSQLAICQTTQDRMNEMLLGALGVNDDSAKKNVWIQDLLDLGASVNHRLPEGETPLHLAARRGDEKAVDLLLQAGADERARTTGGFTADDLLDGPHRGIRLLLQKASDRRRERGSDRRHCGWIAILRKRRTAGVAGGDGGGAGARPAKLRRSSRLAPRWGGEEVKEFLVCGAPDCVFKNIIGFL